MGCMTTTTTTTTNSSLDAPIVGSIEGQQPQLQNLGQPQPQQQQNDEDLVDLFSNDQGSIEGQQPPQLQNLGQAQQQQQNDEDPMLTMDDLLSDDHHMTFNPDTIQELKAENTTNDVIKVLRDVCHDSTLWSKDISGRHVLNLRQFEGHFLPSTNNQPNIEASKDHRSYAINYQELATMLIEENWSALFPFLVAKEEIIKEFILCYPSSGYPDGSLKLIYKEFRVITPGAAKRTVNVLRACKQINEGMLAVLEVSFEPDQVENGKQSNCHRFPSGCVIEELSTGMSRVTWVEHMGVADVVPDSITRCVAKGMLDQLQTLCQRTRIQKTICSSESRGFDDQGTCIPSILSR